MTFGTEEDEGGFPFSGAKFDALAGARSERTAGTDLKATIGAITETTDDVDALVSSASFIAS